MVSYSYKDHDYRLSPAVLLVCCWDQRGRKPTSFFWALFCIVSFAAIHWYLNPVQPATQSVSPDDVLPDNPKFKGINKGQYPVPEEPRMPKPQRVKPHPPTPNPNDAEFQEILRENANSRDEMAPQNNDIFVRDFKERGDQPHPPLDHNQHRPSPKDFPVEYVNQPTLECGPEGYLVVLLVEDRPDNTGGRLAIRSTWGIQDEVKYPAIAPKTWKTVFVMGNLRGKNADYFNSAVNAESKKFGDILQGEFEDNAHESTRKFMMALKWLNENKGSCPTRFVLKSRDDIYLNMNSITEWLEKRWGPDDTMLYVGRVLKDDVPIRKMENPLYVSQEDYDKDYFPNMIEGPVMLFDWLAFERLYISLKFVTPIAMEDAFIGLLAEKAHMSPMHNEHFQLIKVPSNVCAQLKVFFMNKMLPKHHIEVFNTIKSARVKNLCPDAKILYHKDGLNKKHFEV